MASFDLGLYELATQNLDHLGIVSSVAQELGIVQKLDARLPVSAENGAHVTMGERMLGMILNGLRFTNDRLYMVSDFFQNKPVGRLIAPHVKAERLNDDALGRCLDAIHSYGTTKLFSEQSFERERKTLDKKIEAERVPGNVILEEFVTNLNDVSRKIIRYFGANAMRIYDITINALVPIASTQKLVSV